MIRTDIFECLWLSEEVQNEDIEVGFLLVSTCTNWNQILSYDICVPAWIALSGVKKKHFLYKLHISFIYFFFLLFNVTHGLLRKKQEETASVQWSQGKLLY